MKTEFIFLVGLMFAFASISSAQSVKITAKEVTYKRGEDLSEGKLSYTVIYPKVEGEMGKKIEALLSYEKIFGLDIPDTTGYYWLDAANYNVNYNDNNILNITLFIEGSGAYSSESSLYLTVNTQTGTLVKPYDIFTNLSELATIGEKARQAEMKTEIEKLQNSDRDFDPKELFFDLPQFTTENLLIFTMSNTGLTFKYDYGFPHAFEALEPKGDYFFSWAELKPFIIKDGLFGRFVKSK